MPKQKHDYEKMKKDFLASKFTDVKSFILDRGMTYNAAIRMNAKGWAKEKRDLKARATDKAIKQIEQKLANKLEPSSEFLLGNISKAIELSARKLEQMQERDAINVKDLNTIRGMNRIQNNQPTTYVKSENENFERIEGIHIVIGGNPIDSKKNDENNA